jgi:hypothetical protein
MGKIDKWDICVAKGFKNMMERKCCTRGKVDTETLTLQ